MYGMSQAPRPAATLVLLRPEADGFSVLLMKRPSKSSFMAGMHVFPGGRMEDADVPLLAGPLGAALGQRMGLTAALAEGYAQAALRETFEEMGLLVSGESLEAQALRQAREAMARDELAWTAWAPSRQPPAKLVYFDHWITPEIEPKRFDTRFFAAVAPGVEPEPNAEAISWGFFRPQEALALIERGEMAMAPPTLVTMLRLARYAALDEALASLAARTVAPLQPELAGGAPLTLALPGHPAHSVKQRAHDNPTAIIMKDGGSWEILW